MEYLLQVYLTALGLTDDTGQKKLLVMCIDMTKGLTIRLFHLLFLLFIILLFIILLLRYLQNNPLVHGISLGTLSMGQNTQYQNALS